MFRSRILWLDLTNRNKSSTHKIKKDTQKLDQLDEHLFKIEGWRCNSCIDNIGSLAFE